MLFIEVEWFLLSLLLFLVGLAYAVCLRAETLAEVGLRQVKVTRVYLVLTVVVVILLLIHLLLHHLDVRGPPLHTTTAGFVVHPQTSTAAIIHCILMCESVFAVGNVEI